LRRSSSVRSAGKAQKRACWSLGSISVPRRRIGSPSIAVHSTSNMNAIRPRTYQIASIAASVSAGARTMSGR